MQRGFSLLEVLIAILVLVLGMLAVGALLLKALSNGREAYMRGQAALLVDEISDAMRANPVYNASQNPTWTQYIESSYSDHTNASGVTACNASGWCSQTQLAAFDLVRWKQDIASSTLPGAQAIVCWVDSPETASAGLGSTPCTASPNASTPIAVAVVWQYRSKTAGVASATQTGSYVVRFNPVGSN
jgi:type IV pilus assembly protein PilV